MVYLVASSIVKNGRYFLRVGLILFIKKDLSHYKPKVIFFSACSCSPGKFYPLFQHSPFFVIQSAFKKKRTSGIPFAISRSCNKNILLGGGAESTISPLYGTGSNVSAQDTSE
jgi:hypothetical protein